MATWDEGIEEISCPTCGAKHRVTYSDFPGRERGELACKAEGCGATLVKWNGTRDYHVAKLIEDHKK